MIFLPVTRKGNLLFSGDRLLAMCADAEVAEDLMLGLNDREKLSQAQQKLHDSYLEQANEGIEMDELIRDNKALEYDNDYLRSVIKELEEELAKL